MSPCLRSRVAVAGLSLGLLGLCGGIGIWVHRRTPWLDTVLHDLVVQNRSPALVGLARIVTEGGSTSVIWPVIAVAAMVFPRTAGAARWLTWAAVAGGAAAGIGVRLLLSEILRRPRPPGTDWLAVADGYSFPSGHTTAATIGAGLLAWAVTRHLRHREARAAVWAAAAVWAIGVGVTRVVLGVHWPLDVVGGWLLGAAWLTGMAMTLAAIPGEGSHPDSRWWAGR